ncbi:unnamed protein product [Parnassius mnemosyne]|uniref:Endonuclease/exonuclease/phosphatase domain-containing protein n=1 Tax=Parnassius mnemosyne TaxID=213953 RepID=A0AAV1M1Z4_9NEOP
MNCKNDNLTLISFNCKSIERSFEDVRDLCEKADCVILQETWLLPWDIPILGKIHKDFGYTGNSAIDVGAEILRGRPYGGVAILWRKSVFQSVSVITSINLIKTIVVLIVKNKTGDISDKSNYRPISLATVTAKVLDRLLSNELQKVLQIHEA